MKKTIADAHRQNNNSKYGFNGIGILFFKIKNKNTSHNGKYKEL